MTTKIMSRADLELIGAALKTLADNGVVRGDPDAPGRAARLKLEFDLALKASARAPSQAFRIVKV